MIEAGSDGGPARIDPTLLLVDSNTHQDHPGSGSASPQARETQISLGSRSR